jgi:hypothetical protein
VGSATKPFEADVAKWRVTWARPAAPEGLRQGYASLQADVEEATQDAQRRADEIAGSAGSRVGALLSARAGVFQITEPYSTEVSGFGVHCTATRRKEITVTVHGDFELR